MLFHSYNFILYFLPIAVMGYFACCKSKSQKLPQIWLIIASLVFYGCYSVPATMFLSAGVIINYGMAVLAGNAEKSDRFRRFVINLGICINILQLFYFKYYNFFLENVNRVLGTEYTLKQILLPLGISFIIFQQIAYLVDSWHGETKEYDFADYALYILYFPKLCQGPIALHEQLIPQFSEQSKRIPDQRNIAKGLYVLASGLFKKVIVADTLAKAVAWGFADVTMLSSADTLLVMLAYTLQIYFDFSGYCDMAGGISLFFNIELPMNFNSPYKAVSIMDFWGRWHITLSRFLRKYIYFPLGGSRGGRWRTYRNILIVFLVSGIWHGANWTFIVWGLMHGVFNVLTRMFQKGWDKLYKGVRWFITFSFVNVAWLLFRSESFQEFGILLQNIVAKRDFSISRELLSSFELFELTYVEEHLGALGARLADLHIWVFLLGGLAGTLFLKNCWEKEFRPTLWRAVVAVGLFVWCVMSFGEMSAFLYFNF